MSKNIYYDPEKFGLKTIGEVEWSDGNYQFDLTVVWQDAFGQLYMASDAGCSCPTPFEDIHLGSEGLAKVTKQEAIMALQNRQVDEDSYGHRPKDASADLIEKLMTLK